MAHVLAKDLREAVLNSALNGGLSTTIDTDKNVWENGIENIESNEYDVPDTWKLITIGSITNIKNGFTPKRTIVEYWNSKDIPWFTVDDIHDQGHEIRETVQYISNKALGKNSTRIIKPNTVLLCCTSATIGNYAITRLPVTTNQQWNGLEVKEKYSKEIISEFILIWAMTLKNKMISVAGSTTFPFLSTKKLANFPIPLPPVEEQVRIVARVDELMTKIDEYEKLENELVELKKNFPGDMKAAVLQAAMQGKLTDIYDYVECEYGDMFEISGGSQPSKNAFIDTPKEGYIQLYQTRDYGEKPQPVYIPIKYATKQTKEGDILLARYGGSLGKVFWAKDGAYNVAMAKVIFNMPELHDPRFVYYYHLSPIYQGFCSSIANGRSAQAGFNKDDIGSLPYHLFTIEEQRQIVEKLDKILPLCEELEKEIA